MNPTTTNHTSINPTTPGTDRRNGPSSLTDRVRSLKLPQRSAASSGSRPWLPWLLVLVFAGAAGYLYVKQNTAATPSEDESAEATAAVNPTSAPSTSGGLSDLTAGGYVIPVHRVLVSPKVGGQIKALYIEEGDYIKEGQKIALVDPVKYEFEFRRKKALADQARAKYDRLKAGYRDQEKNRAAALLQEAKELRRQQIDEVRRMRQSGAAASADELVKAESKLLQTEQRVIQMSEDLHMMREGYRQEDKEEAKNEYARAVAEMEDAKYDLDNTVVLAPVNGIVLTKKAEVGNTVLPNVPSNGLSASLCEMANLKELEVDVDVSERDLGQVKKGQKCEIRTEADMTKVYKGRVSRLMPEANRSKASVSVRVRIDVPDGDQFLRPEMRARIVFLGKDEGEKQKK